MDGKEGEKKEDERGKKHVKILHARETEKTVKKFEHNLNLISMKRRAPISKRKRNTIPIYDKMQSGLTL